MQFLIKHGLLRRIFDKLSGRKSKADIIRDITSALDAFSDKKRSPGPDKSNGSG